METEQKLARWKNTKEVINLVALLGTMGVAMGVGFTGENAAKVVQGYALGMIFLGALFTFTNIQINRLSVPKE